MSKYEENLAVRSQFDLVFNNAPTMDEIERCKQEGEFLISIVTYPEYKSVEHFLSEHKLQPSDYHCVCIITKEFPLEKAKEIFIRSYINSPMEG